MHKFVVGVAPVRSLCRVGWAAKQLLSIPADQLHGNGSASTVSSDVRVSRQLRRGVTALARAVTLEALGLGASVAGGADYVLRGGSGAGSEQPAGKWTRISSLTPHPPSAPTPHPAFQPWLQSLSHGVLCRFPQTGSPSCPRVPV